MSKPLDGVSYTMPGLVEHVMGVVEELSKTYLAEIDFLKLRVAVLEDIVRQLSYKVDGHPLDDGES